ncbi:MAG: DUF1849 family protein [Pseudomonadota bacterium]
MPFLGAAKWLLLGGLLGSNLAFAQPATASEQGGDLLAHRAVYELSLERADRDTSVQDAAGLFVFQVKGSSCAGWTILSDIVLTIGDRAGGTIRTETQYRAFEAADGGVFTFQTETRSGADDEAMVTGAAERAEDGGLSIRRFDSGELQASAPMDTLFPNQLTHAILDAARADERLVFATVFDGSHESGQAQPASVIIGAPVAPTVIDTIAANGTAPGDGAPDAGERWDDFPTPSRAWPVKLSYFDPTATDSGPSFVVSYTLDTNGVSDDLILDYGSFSLRGVLSDFTAFLPSACPE